MVIVNFIRDSEVGIFSRAKRLSKEARAAAAEQKRESENDSVADLDNTAGQK